MNPRVKTVKPVEGYKLRLEFTNGEVGVFDCSPLLDFGVFQELRDVQYFKQVRVCMGSIAWPHEQDICPDTLYLESIRVKANTKRKSRAAALVTKAYLTARAKRASKKEFEKILARVPDVEPDEWDRF